MELLAAIIELLANSMRSDSSTDPWADFMRFCRIALVLLVLLAVAVGVYFGWRKAHGKPPGKPAAAMVCAWPVR